MAVVIETTLGDITVDLYLEQRPITCLNFLKLCKMKYYNFNLFHTIRSGFIAQTGDPTGEGNGGESIWGILEGPEKRFFSGEKMPKIRHTDAGLLSMVCTGDMMVGSQFFFTLAPDLDSLDSVHCVIGEVTEGQDVLRKLNDAICDETYRPYQDVRITHTVVLEDPFNDPPGLRAPSRSPSPSAERLKGGRIAPDEEIDETKGKSTAEIQEMIEEKEAKARATILEIVGDLPDADIAPPENVLFVCKLNPVTTDDDLEIIFSRFGKIISCEVIRDKKTGDSLQYAFIEFSDKKSCEDAYFKMDNVLIDDRRIHVDFSQSVSKIKWLGKGRGVKHITNDNIETKRSSSKDRNRNDKEMDKYSKQRNLDSRYTDKYNSSRRDHDRKRDKHDRKYHNEREPTNNYKNREKNRSRSKERIREKKHGLENTSSTDQNNHFHIKNHRQKMEREKSSDRNQYNKLTKHDSYKNDREYSSKSTSDPRSSYKSQSNNSFKKNQSESYDTNRGNRNSDKQSSKYYETDNRESSKSSKLKESNEAGSQKEKKSKKRDHEEPKTPSPILEKNIKGRNKTVNKKMKEKKTKNIKRKRELSTSSDSDTSDSTSSSDSSTSSEEQKSKRKNKKKKYSSSSSSETSNSSSSSSSSSESSTSTSSSSDSDNKKKRQRKCEKTRKTKKDIKK